MTAVVATGPVAMGTTTTTGTNLCPKTLTVTLAGQTSSSWATDAIVKAVTAIKTDSDGYKMTISMTSNNNALLKDKYFGGCLSGAGALATNPVVCFYGKGVDAITETTGGTAPNDHSLAVASAVIPYMMPVANWKTTAAVTGSAGIAHVLRSPSASIAHVLRSPCTPPFDTTLAVVKL